MPPIDLIVTDLDRTLWAEELIHDRTLAALSTLEARGFPVLVATGRRRRSAEEGLARSGLRLPAVTLDGAMGRDRDGRAFHDAVFSADEAIAVLAAFRRAGLEPAVYVDRPTVEVVVGPRPSTHQLHLDYVGQGLHRGDLDATVREEPVYAFAVMGGETAAVHAAAREVGTFGVPWVTDGLVLPGTHVSVRPPGVSKWAGVLSWCADQGIDPTRVLAVGDGENDVELLAGASVAVVVSDGCDAALALADHVIDPATSGGWGTVLDLLA